jgi:hypothetical protein
VQRGIDRQACFFTDDDYRAYLDWLVEASCHWVKGLELILFCTSIHGGHYENVSFRCFPNGRTKSSR